MLAVSALSLLALGASDPGAAVLADPTAAAAAARGAARAEAWRLAGRPERALEVLEGLPDGLPRLRQEAHARVELELAPGRLLDALAAEPGWARHAVALRARAAAVARRHLAERVGLGLFAGALAGLLLGGSRALFRVTRASAAALVAAALAAGVAAALAPRGLGLVVLLGGALSTLVHAAAAVRARTSAGARGRSLLAALVILGTLGAGLAALARLGPARLAGQVARLERGAPLAPAAREEGGPQPTARRASMRVDGGTGAP